MGNFMGNSREILGKIMEPPGNFMRISWAFHGSSGYILLVKGWKNSQ